MKKLLLITLIGLGCISQNAAQQTNQTTNRDTGNTTQNDYERMLDAQLQMGFRSYALRALELTSEQIQAFDPIFREYMQEKGTIVNRKFNVLNKYSQEAKQATTQGTRSEDWADAVEDYWEAQIAEMQLQKRYFDRLEDKIPPQKALSFFMLEDAALARVREMRYGNTIPLIMETERTPNTDAGSNIQGDTMDNQQDNMTRDMNMNRDTSTNQMNNNTQTQQNDRTSGNNQMRDTTTMNTTTTIGTSTGRSSIVAYDTWARNYTGNKTADRTATAHTDIQEGLTKLVGAIDALAAASKATPGELDDKRTNILNNANKLAEDPASNQHAQLASEAFKNVADLLESLGDKNDQTDMVESIGSVRKAAQAIKTAQPLNNQADAVTNFFTRAHVVVNKMANSIDWNK